MPPAAGSQRPPGGPGYLDGLRAGAPIGIAAFAFGVSFGVLARSAGMGQLAPVVMSLTTFAGSAQFAAASILGAGGGLVTAIVAAVLLNLRYGPIGLSAATTFEGPWWWRTLTAQLIVDESWAIAQRDDGRLDRHLLVGAGLLLLVTTGIAMLYLACRKVTKHIVFFWRASDVPRPPPGWYETARHLWHRRRSSRGTWSRSASCARPSPRRGRRRRRRCTSGRTQSMPLCTR